MSCLTLAKSLSQRGRSLRLVLFLAFHCNYMTVHYVFYVRVSRDCRAVLILAGNDPNLFWGWSGIYFHVICLSSVWLWLIPLHSSQMYGASAALGLGGSMLLVTVLTMLADLIGQNVVRKLSLRTRGGPWKVAQFPCEEYHFDSKWYLCGRKVKELLG